MTDSTVIFCLGGNKGQQRWWNKKLILKAQHELKHLRVLQLNHAVPEKLCPYADLYSESSKGENNYKLPGFKTSVFL